MHAGRALVGVVALGLSAFWWHGAPPALRGASSSRASSSPPSALRVSGNKIVGEDGLPIQLVGMSLFHTADRWNGAKYYNKNVVGTLVDDWKCRVVRATLSVEEDDGFLFDKKRNERVLRQVVEAAIDRGIYVIIDFHTHQAEHHLKQARCFFRRMARAYGSRPNVIFEIYNEPITTAWSTKVDHTATPGLTVRDYAASIIPVIRDHSSNLVVVGTRFYSQHPEEAALDPLTEFDNVAYGFHFYAASHRSWLRSLAAKAMLGTAYQQPDKTSATPWRTDQNPTPIPIFVTEWGTVDSRANGTPDEQSTRAWLKFLNDHHVSHVQWALEDKQEGAAALKPGASTSGKWSKHDLTMAGDFARQILRRYAHGIDVTNRYYFHVFDEK
ncbi:hypothetical protein CTAYLR_008921 [Chrysophaeum taylorii]|uniref:Glycoside hydrolase family 5 domain-containing protein n=1 Tax=Chrysophaeum taylorii TaxID=2483200 RepID=A0AAD7UDP1_9STRA|nr:hypothetical protein CTAYLR_008921 [Chrysophaeum taylorii]